MPTINRRYMNAKPVRYKREIDNDHAKFYQSKAWHLLRQTFLSHHPVCQCCLKHHHVEPAIDIHHKRPFMTGETEEERWNLFLKESNLQALCETCHHALHIKAQRYNLKYIDELTDEEYEEAHCQAYA